MITDAGSIHQAPPLLRRIIDHLAHPGQLIRSYRRADLMPDLVAGATVAAVAIPQAIAYASIAELPPHYGLYTAVVAAVVGSLWGSSRFLATGPVNAVSLLVLPILLAVGQPGTVGFLLAASTLALLVGAIDIVLAVLRFGAVVTLAARSVLLGFTAGAAIHIAVGQLKHLLRIDVLIKPELYHTVVGLVSHAGDLHTPSLLIGLGSLVLLIGLRSLGPRVPAALATITVAAVVVVAGGLHGQGVAVVGEIPRSFPPLTWAALDSFPEFDMAFSLVVGALAVAALGLVEAVASAQALGRQRGDRIDTNQEFFAQGVANIACGLLSGYPCSGSFTRSSLAFQAGARTRMTGVITGVVIVAGMLVLAPYAHHIPRSAIAAVLLVVAWGMIDREGIRRVLSTSRQETAMMLVTFVATLALPLDFAVLAGILFSLGYFVVSSSLPRVYQVVPDDTFRHLVRNPAAPVCPQLGILNIRGPLFFGAVYHIEEELLYNYEEHPGQSILMLRMHGVDLCDLSGIEMLEATVQRYRDLHGDVFLVRPRQPVLAVMESSGFLDGTLGRDHILPQEGAIEYLFEEVLDPAVCIYECECRVFAECQALEKHHYEIRVPTPARHSEVHSRRIDPERFQVLASAGNAVIVDVREPKEYARGHIPGARLLPLRQLIERAGELPRDRPILLICRSGRRSTRALHMLMDLGFEEVWGLSGGILSWRAEGLPVSAGEP